MRRERHLFPASGCGKSKSLNRRRLALEGRRSDLGAHSENHGRGVMPVRKKRERKQPHKVLQLTTYQRLEEYLRAFAQGHFHLLILVGSGGLAKSRSVKVVLDGKAC